METERIVRKQERRTITGVADTQWDEMEGKGEAPRRRLLGRRAVGWKLSELMQWIDERPPVPISGNRPADEGATNSQAARLMSPIPAKSETLAHGKRQGFISVIQSTTTADANTDFRNALSHKDPLQRKFS